MGLAVVVRVRSNHALLLRELQITTKNVRMLETFQDMRMELCDVSSHIL